MADEVVQNNDVNLSDVIKDQSETIKTLVDQVKSSAGDSTQPIYQQTITPKEDKKPNYVLYIALAVAAWFMIIKKGRIK